MAKFLYVGDPNDPNDILEDKELYGILFPVGEPVEVPDDFEFIGKLRGNNHLVEEGTEEASTRTAKKRGRPSKRVEA